MTILKSLLCSLTVLTAMQMPLALAAGDWTKPVQEQRLLAQANRQAGAPANAESKGGRHGRHHGKGGSCFSQLNLSDAQKAQMKTLMASKRQEHQGYRQQFESILTPEQKAQLQAQKGQARTPGQHPGKGFFSQLNLSTAQQDQLKAFKQARQPEREAFHQQMMAILTPEQREKLKATKDQRKESCPHHRPDAQGPKS